ncbi:hypothetical protein DICPUDRAFT_38569 [Dictyostelium purpureum]|uniref:Condensation domain-containing protein n=1 Tax=Dictyostelium purpureum TaxID=5786 RepID=F0ZUS0_DICPU|nr:uncharacterized protein DICPUDRAFT_38569 [Dictyostelium purpureum]EGC32323.1 hypothetical protein DICPUDRAFT_38569 [Dictyostelium purpureum]|eukprot:XP_003291165.1 hypothetical protein DICPUDRAFT_38569 [Dictyostelium purpureum]
MTTNFGPDKSFLHKVGPVEHFSASLFSRGGLWYNGTIDIEKFALAVKESLKDFYFIHSTLHKDEGGEIYASYSENENFEHLEIEEREESIKNATLELILPKKNISLDQQMGFSKDLNGQVMGVLKLTKYTDGFVIGYNFSHTLFDQGSMVYYFKYLANIYNGRPGLKKPQIVDILSLGHNIPLFKDINEVREYGSKVLRYIYKPISAHTAPAPNLNIIVQIKLDIDEIDKLKSTSPQYLSRNDLIGGILIKIYNFSNKEENFTYGYVCNIRKYLGVGEEAISNLIHQRRMTIDAKDIIKNNTVELAQLVRKNCSEITIEGYTKYVAWCKYLKDEKQNMAEYFNNPTHGMTRTSNWTSFDYDSISFDNSAPISLRHYTAAFYGVNIISFDTDENGKKYYTTQISIPSNDLEKVKEYGEVSKLYSIDKDYKL